MKNTAVKVLLVMTVLSAGLLCVLLFLAVSRPGEKKQESKLKQFQEQYDKHPVNSKMLAPEVYYDFSEEVTGEELYDVTRHKAVSDRIDAMKRSGTYSEDAPLVVWNPYGVNALSVYVYFETEVPMKVSYRISGKSSELTTFSAQCYSKDEYTSSHEYLLLGLFAGESNRIAITMEDEKENVCVRTFWVEAGELYGVGKDKLDKSKGASEEKLSEGFFVHLGNETGVRENVLFYDNDGILRGELPLISGSCKRLLFFNDLMYYNVSDKKIVGVNGFGQAECSYELSGYTIGNDYCIDEDNKKLLLLACKEGKDSEGVNDRIVSVDLISGEIKELLDMGTYLKEYKAECEKNEDGVLEWLNLNSIQLVGTGVLVGARELSAAIKIGDIYEVPVVEYFIGEPKLFEGTGYESQLLLKTSDFPSFYGANTLTCVREDGMPDGVYYLYLYDNHIGGTPSRPDFDYSQVEGDLGTSLKKGTASYFCRYLVNEVSKTWQQEEMTELEYSGYGGSAQLEKNGHLITDTAGRFRYSEFDKNRVLINSFTGSGTQYLGRVFKYDFKGFYFAGDARKKETAE